MKTTVLMLVAVWSCTTVAARAAERGRPGPELFSAVGRSIVHDSETILTSPLRWYRGEWFDFAASSAGLLASASLDRTVRNQTINRRPSNLAKQVQNFDSIYSFGALAALEGYDLVEHDTTARAVALDGVTASVIAGGIVTAILKYSFGRYRPNQTDRTFEFKPFQGKQSFPSGHATQAFAVATVIAFHYDEWWVQTLAYGTAAAVGYSRIQQHAHYLSDISAGALMGYFVGRSVVH